jgi:Uma2 family endonuclease
MTPAVQPTPKPALLTAEEFVAKYENQRVELVRGHVVEVPMPTLKHGKICLRVAVLLAKFVDANDLGHVMTNDSFVRTAEGPDSVRGADVCFFSYSRLPKGPVAEGLLDVRPELVFEVRSPSDRWTKVVAKAIEYLDAGVKVVVVLDPKTESATVYRADEKEMTVEKDGTLTIPDVLPGFAVPVRAFFE